MAFGQPSAFYQQRLAEGISASELGQHETARRELETAAFGLLDRPNELAVALVQLALCEHRTSRQANFQEVFERLIVVEERFGALSNGPIEPTLREDFESAVRERIPASRLSAIDSLAHLAVAAPRPDLDRLSAKQLRKTLEQRRSTDPTNPEWDLRLADLEEKEGRDEEAIDFLGRAITKLEDAGSLHCRRGQLLAIAERCEEAVVDLAACPLRFRNTTLAATAISCLRELDREPEAKQWLAGVPTDLRAQPALETATLDLLEVGEALPAAMAAPDGTDSANLNTSVAPSATEFPRPPASENSEGRRPDNGLPATELTELARSKSLGKTASNQQEIETAFEISRAVAERNPTSRAAQYNTAQLAYRASRWADAVKYFDRGGRLEDAQTTLLFYRAVALFESGATQPAAETLERALPKLVPSPFVDQYVTRIQQAAAN